MPLGDNWVPYRGSGGGGGGAPGPDPSTTGPPSDPIKGPTRPNIPYAPGPQPGTEFKGPKPYDPSKPASGPSSPWKPPGQRGALYTVRNGNSNQFNWTGVRNAVEKGLNAYATSQFYRKAGFTAGLRGALGMKPTPSHMNDWIRARHGGNGGVVGVNPSPSLEEEYEHW